MSCRIMSVALVGSAFKDDSNPVASFDNTSVEQILKTFGGITQRGSDGTIVSVFYSPSSGLQACRQLLLLPEVKVPVVLHTGEMDPLGDLLDTSVVQLAKRILAVTTAGTLNLSDATITSIDRSNLPTCQTHRHTFSGIYDIVKFHTVLDLSVPERRGSQGTPRTDSDQPIANPSPTPQASQTL